MKKLFSILLALLLFCGAATAETPFGTLFDAATELAFDTHNVTLSAEATFRYDGELFKVMHASYQQDDVRSFLSYMLDTPDLAGKMTTSGYIVLGLGEKSYAGDYKFGYYYENGTKVSDTVLQKNNRTEAQLKLARLLALSAEELVEEKHEGNTYTFKAGRLPELINSAAYYTLLDYVQDNYYIDMFQLYDYSTHEATVYTEDWLGMVAQQYKALYGEEMPSVDDIYEDDTLFGRYSVAINAANQAEAEAAANYTDGIVLIKADGSIQWFDSEESYRLSTGEVDIYYADWSKAFNNYYNSVYGETLTDEQLDYVLYSPNPELNAAYTAFQENMIDYYRKAAKEANPDALTCMVMEDGSIKTYNYLMSYGVTTWQRILSSMRYAVLKELDATVTTDDEGRLTGLKGTITAEITDKQGKLHDFSVEYDCKAEEYGTTNVPSTFEPEKYNLISSEEYERRLMKEYETDENDQEDYWSDIIKNDPGTVTFGGVTYETMMTLYSDTEN